MRIDNNYLEKIREYEKKHGISYIRTSDRTYLVLLLSALFFWSYTTLMSLLTILANIVLIENPTSDIKFIYLIIVFAFSVLTPIIYLLKLKITAILINIATMITQLILFGIFMRVDGNYYLGAKSAVFDKGILGLKKIFYVRYGIPIMILFILLTGLLFIIVRERFILKKEYIKISENEYVSEILQDNE